MFVLFIRSGRDYLFVPGKRPVSRSGRGASWEFEADRHGYK